MWRVVTRRIATLTEVSRDWCLDDLVDANLALDLEEDIERERARRAEATA